MATIIQLRRDTATNWTNNNPVLAQGEVGIETDTLKIKVGNGSSSWTSLSYINTGDGLELGETSLTAYRGDRGKTAYDHSQSTHAPSNAQKNSDITKSEIEAKLTGEISTHTHAGGGTSTTVNPVAKLSPFNTVLITRANGNNLDNHPDNFIKVTANNSNVLTLNTFPADFIADITKEWVIYAFENGNFSGTTGDYRKMRKIQSYDIANKTVTILDEGASFVNKAVALMCTSNIGILKRRSDSSTYEVEDKTSIASLFSITAPLYISFIDAFVETISSTTYVTCLYYFQNGTYWQPHYVRYTMNASGELVRVGATTLGRGKCLASLEVNGHHMIVGKHFETSTQRIWAIRIDSSPVLYRTLVYTKATQEWSLSTSNLFSSYTTDTSDSGEYFAYINYLGFDGKYYYITANRRGIGSTLPSATGEVLDESTYAWKLYELRSTSVDSGFTDEVLLYKSYDDYSAIRNFPEVTYTFKYIRDIYLCISGTNYFSQTGTRNNREFVVWKRLGFGIYEKDTRSPLIINPVGAGATSEFGYISTVFPYDNQRDHLGGSIAIIYINNKSYLIYNASDGKDSYKIFMVEKPELNLLYK